MACRDAVVFRAVQLTAFVSFGAGAAQGRFRGGFQALDFLAGLDFEFDRFIHTQHAAE